MADKFRFQSCFVLKQSDQVNAICRGAARKYLLPYRQGNGSSSFVVSEIGNRITLHITDSFLCNYFPQSRFHSLVRA